MSATASGGGHRILALTAFPPSTRAMHGGGRVMAQLLLELAGRHRVAILAIRSPGAPPTDAELRDRCELVEDIPGSADAPTVSERIVRRYRLARDLLRGIPQWPSDLAVPAFHARVASLTASWQPDVIQLEYHVMAQYVEALAGAGAPRVLTEHEPGIVAARERTRTRRLGARLELLAWERFERRALAAVDAVVVFTERDRAALAAVGQRTPIVRIPLGFALPPRPLDPAGVEPPRLVFVGSFRHPPNIDAATRLATSIVPLVLARHPEVVLDVVGSDPPRAVRATASAHVIVSGTVPDVTPYLERAAVVVAPLRLGGGMRVKVLEALAAGKALVASPLAVEGLDVVDGEQLLLAETDAEFSRQIGRLLDDRAARMSLAARARAWACAQHGWDRPVAAYEALYEELLEARAHSGARARRRS